MFDNIHNQIIYLCFSCLCIFSLFCWEIFILQKVRTEMLEHVVGRYVIVLSLNLFIQKRVLKMQEKS